MNRKIGGHVSTAGGPLNAITNTQAIDGNCMQIFAGSPRSWIRAVIDDDIASEFRNKVKKLNLSPVYIHALYLINLTSSNNLTLEKSLSALKSELQNSVLIGSAGVILHIGSYTDRSFDIVANDLINRINSIIEEVPDSILILENSAGQKGKIGTLEELGFIVNKLDNHRIKICLDSAHLFADKYNLASDDGIKMLDEDLEKFNLIKYLDCLHVNDSRSGFGSHRDIHENLGKGEIGISGLKSFVNMPLLKQLPIILEVPGDPKSKIKGPNKENITIASSLVS